MIFPSTPRDPKPCGTRIPWTADSGDGSGPRRARDLLDAAWDLLAPAQRRLIETLDFNLAWPRIRNWIATDPDLPEKPAWVFHLLESLHFRRIFRLLAAAADRGGNP